jgi:hypothetical protein
MKNTQLQADQRSNDYKIGFSFKHAFCAHTTDLSIKLHDDRFL